jgi:hypothetical protein
MKPYILLYSLYLFFHAIMVIIKNKFHLSRLKEGHFIQGDTAFYFVGIIIGIRPSLGLMDNTIKGLQRLRQELDFLKSQASQT